MKKRYLIIFALLIFGILCAPAQRKKRRTVKKKPKAKKEVVVDETAMERLRLMELATQDIIVVDSIVVDKGEFLNHYALSDDAGSLMKHSEFFGRKSYDSAYVYINEMQDKCYISDGDTTSTRLYTSDLVGDKWTKPARVNGIVDSLFPKQNYPFMMADGTTLYFASTGPESVGGYDIFVTRYDAEGDRYFKPENIGMPFNSTANDYMYAVDEMNSLGWFASDRNQPQDKVCIYTFIPTETRNAYSNRRYSEEQIRSRARLTRIADTWKNSKQRNEALKRLKTLRSNTVKKERKTAMHFVINDRLEYTAVTQFKVKENVDKYINVQKMKSQLASFNESLDKSRKYYPSANAKEKASLNDEILRTEQAVEFLELEIERYEKEIRNAENEYLTKNRKQ